MGTAKLKQQREIIVDSGMKGGECEWMVGSWIHYSRESLKINENENQSITKVRSHDKVVLWNKSKVLKVLR